MTHTEDLMRLNLIRIETLEKRVEELEIQLINKDILMHSLKTEI
tara:strand:- start:102 stop:233 length:132 start_codon:yes stop_codon:yes gene_type:complete